MKLIELAELMGKTEEELIKQLKQNDVIELKLTEKANKGIKDSGAIEVLN